MELIDETVQNVAKTLTDCSQIHKNKQDPGPGSLSGD